MTTTTGMNWKTPLTAALLAAALLAQPAWSEASVDLISAGVGTWISIPTQRRFQDETYYSKVSTGLYATIFGFKTYVGLPLAWTVDTRYDEVERDQIMLGDMQFYVGRKVGFVEPRLGMRFPLGYSTEPGTAWIGPGNVRIQAGLGLNADVRQTDKLNASAEVMYVLYLGEGKAGAGTWDLLPSAKISIRPADPFLIGLEILGSVQRGIWGEDWVKVTVGAVPNIYMEYRWGTVAMNAKVGYGPNVAKSPDTGGDYDLAGSALNLSLSVSIYP